MTDSHFIIISSGGAASSPYRHQSWHAAKQEAERLARENRGLSFTIYESRAAVQSLLVDFTAHTSQLDDGIPF